MMEYINGQGEGPGEGKKGKSRFPVYSTCVFALNPNSNAGGSLFIILEVKTELSHAQKTLACLLAVMLQVGHNSPLDA